MSTTTYIGNRAASSLLRVRGSLLSVSALLTAAPLFGVLALAVVINWPTLHDYFHGDDYLAFIDLATKPTLRHLGEVITFTDSNVYWRPIGEVYYLALWETFGINEVAFHVANLTVFLITLVLLYVFCMQAGFGRYVASGACAFLVLFPNHVVSVAWITNGPRLVAVMFALASLVLLQRALTERRAYLEVLSFLAFLVAGLADEVALSLAPLALLYPLMLHDDRKDWLKRASLRALPYAAMALFLIPLQFIATDNDPGFRRLKFGWQMPEHIWALTSKLVWPSQDGISFAQITGEQWTAGAIALAIGALALAAGSNRLRFLTLWVALGLAPFTIWTTPIAPARYLYMAAVPFAVVAAWALVYAVDLLRRTVPGSMVARNVPASSLVAAAGLVILIFLGSIGASMTRERDQAFASDAETYRILADGLRQAAPDVPDGARIIIYYGIWNTFHVWPDAVAKTVYKDRKVSVVNVARGQIESGGPGRSPKDVVLFYTGRGFIRAAPFSTSTSPQP